MTKIKYEARKGGPLSNDEANALGVELERMEKKGIPVDPHNVVARAQDPASPIHDLFEWDNEKAAYQHRLQQARTSISSIVIREPSSNKPQRAAFSVTICEEGETRREYISRAIVIERNEYLDQVSRDLYARVLSAAKEAESLGLAKTSPAWSRLVDAVHLNAPLDPKP